MVAPFAALFAVRVATLRSHRVSHHVTQRARLPFLFVNEFHALKARSEWARGQPE